MKTSLLIILAITSLAGCASRTVAVPVGLGPCPLPPELVKMTEEQFVRFTSTPEDIVQVLNKREDQLRAYADTLCAIIESTNQ